MSLTDNKNDPEAYTKDAASDAPTPSLDLISETAIDKAEEKRLLRKLDWSLLPCLAIMYLCNALDKGNLGSSFSYL